MVDIELSDIASLLAAAGRAAAGLAVDAAGYAVDAAGPSERRSTQGRPLLDDGHRRSSDGYDYGRQLSMGSSFGAAAEQTRPERGCLSWTNSFVIVPQDRFYAVEKFGRYTEVLLPGLSFIGLDCLGCCINFRSITSRVTQICVDVKTKTRDHVFVTARVAIQKSVVPTSVVEAMYKLTDVHAQIESYVSDVVRSEIPQMTLSELYEKKDHVSDAVLRHLHVEMREYGFEIHRALVTDITPDREVVQAMIEVNVQRYHRDATMMEAEASQIRLVRAAEGEADAAQLNGEGIARQRNAIVAGLRKAVEDGAADRVMSQDEISNLLIITQYFETLREVAARSGEQLVFMPHSPDSVAENLQQVWEAMAMGGAEAAGKAAPAQAVMAAPQFAGKAPPAATREAPAPRAPRAAPAAEREAEAGATAAAAGEGEAEAEAGQVEATAEVGEVGAAEGQEATAEEHEAEAEAEAQEPEAEAEAEAEAEEAAEAEPAPPGQETMR